MSRIADIIEKRRNLMKFSKPIERYQPIANFESYFESKKRTEGGVSKRLAEIKKMHENCKILQPRPHRELYKYPHDFERVAVDMKVNKKSGSVKVTICLPFLEQYNNYHSKGINVPLNEKVKLMKLAGYPDFILENIINRDLWWKKNEQKNKEFLERVFGKK
jgi:hypothetical protein